MLSVVRQVRMHFHEPVCSGQCSQGSHVFLPARTSMRVVLPAPLTPMRQVSTPGRKAPLMPSSSSSMFCAPSAWTCSLPTAASCNKPHSSSSAESDTPQIPAAGTLRRLIQQYSQGTHMPRGYGCWSAAYLLQLAEHDTKLQQARSTPPINPLLTCTSGLYCCTKATFLRFCIAT